MKSTALFSACFSLLLCLTACRSPQTGAGEATDSQTVDNQNTVSATAARPVEHLDPGAFVEELHAAEAPYLIDCRTPGELEGGMLPNALNLDFRNSSFGDEVAKLDRNRPVFVYCQSGGRSNKSAELLHELGFQRVVDMSGGYGAYRQIFPQPE